MWTPKFITLEQFRAVFVITVCNTRLLGAFVGIVERTETGSENGKFRTLYNVHKYEIILYYDTMYTYC